MLLGLEISRDFAAAVICDPAGAAQWALRRDFPPHASPAIQWVSAMELCHDLMRRAALERGEIERAGVSFEGQVSRDGQIENDPTRPGWAGYDIIRAVREHLGVPSVFAASRGQCEAWGEARFGALQNQSEWLYLHLGHDLESALFLQKMRRIPSDIGGLVVERDGSLDAFGIRGTLRAYCSGAAFESRARSFGMSFNSASEIWNLAPSNFAAQSLCEDFNSRLAQGLASALSLVGNVPLCLGGEFGRAIFPGIAAALASKLREMTPFSPHLIAARLGEDAAALGAAALTLPPIS
ncbi:Sugar kinase of the NBD/HSP70 family, may containing an N-terminal HTH domain [Abditibacterium utsteinense]|uniref:Sugar kinase of the NBD/HSP70 family, may containing an N-terminal HTH domain n=1 Tax=Abditibacterium utsteinense TaxID=1960156 RepID=A0A2S8STU6_9BACT|nr:ROK family protein [Abditibacterium utsteinense]PQV64221.1 Sugar kinase of the NBD/HSP70 family, may containing an N-terminal HTH domain [Abditibacterium utsteinense]